MEEYGICFASRSCIGDWKVEGKGKGNHGCLRGFCFNC